MDLIREADERAQATFRRALTGYFETGSWVPADVDEYENAERDLEWEVAKSQFDALQTDDEFAGDHFVYPAGVGR